MPITLTPQQRLELEGKGFTVEMMQNVVQHRRSYWDPKSNGWTLPLPADSLRLPYYLRKGFMLDKPPNIQEIPQEIKVETPLQVEECICPECGFKAKDNVGLAVHNRAKHNPKRHYKKSKKGGR